VWQARADTLDPKSADSSPPGDGQDDNGTRVTEDGCIMQCGLDISPPSNPSTGHAHVRSDSGCETHCKTPGHTPEEDKTRMEPIRSDVRSGKRARIPVCFRKREVATRRTLSNLSAQLSTKHLAARSQHQVSALHQRHGMSVPARPVVFFVDSGSSSAIASDSEEDDDSDCDSDLDVDKDSIGSTTASGASSGYGVGETGGDGNATMATRLTELTKPVKTGSRLPQRSAPPSPPPSKLPVLDSRRAKPDQQPPATTPLHKPSSKSPEPTPQQRQQLRQPFVDTPRPTQTNKPPTPMQQQTAQPQVPRPQQMARTCDVHGQENTCGQPPPPGIQSSRQAVGPRAAAASPNTLLSEGKYVSVLLAKTDENKGTRPPNFKWDHMAPMHGISSCTPFHILD
jgi:hypothetical protein